MNDTATQNQIDQNEATSGTPDSRPDGNERGSTHVGLGALRTALLQAGAAAFAKDSADWLPLHAELQELTGADELGRVAELRAYRALWHGQTADAVSFFDQAADGYLTERGFCPEQTTMKQAAAAILSAFFEPYPDDSALLSDVRAWARSRLAAQYATPEQGEAGGELGLSRQHWLTRMRATREHGIELRIDRLTRRTGLGAWETLWILMLLAVEGDEQFNRMRRMWVNDDAHFTVSLMSSLAAQVSGERDRLLACLDCRSPLLRYRLVHLNVPSSRHGTALKNHFIELDESVLAYVGGRDFWPSELGGLVKLHSAEERAGRGFFEKKLDQLDRAMTAVGRRSEKAFVAACGLSQGTSLALALTWAARHQRPLLEVRASLAFSEAAQFESDLRVVLREALLRDGLVFVDGDRNWDENPSATQMILEIINRSADHFGQPIVFDSALEGDDALKQVLTPFFEVRVLPPTLEEQTDIWRDAIAHADLEPIPDSVLRNKVCDMALNVEDIHRAVQLASDNAWLNAADMRVSADGLRSMATSKLNSGMYAIADRVTTALSWSDVILPDKVFESLMEIVTYARYQRKVFEEWGFGAKLPYGRANSSLFTGPPGTGKTMVASIIARELGMDCFRVEMSQVVSKYIGETEKNLGKIFDEAARSHAVILFDEADSLFSKRTEVKSHHDRHNNLEVNYLLQRIESFEGVTILTTNFPKNIDEAFARRIKFKIEFPMPEADDRTKLWRLMLPAGASVAPKIDFDHLGKAFELSGANIKDAVLRAAFRAAERDQVMDTSLLADAAIAMCREAGKLVRVKDDQVHMIH